MKRCTPGSALVGHLLLVLDDADELGFGVGRIVDRRADAGTHERGTHEDDERLAFFRNGRLVFCLLAGFGREGHRGGEQQRQQREQAQLNDHSVIPLRLE